MMARSGIRTVERALLVATRCVRIFVRLEQALSFLERFVVDQPQVLEVAEPLLALLWRSPLLMNVAIQGIADVHHFAPRPVANVLLVSQEPGQVLMSPVLLGGPVVFGRLHSIELASDPTQAPPLANEPVEDTRDPSGRDNVDDVHHAGFGVAAAPPLLTPRDWL